MFVHLEPKRLRQVRPKGENCSKTRHLIKSARTGRTKIKLNTIISIYYSIFYTFCAKICEKMEREQINHALVRIFEQHIRRVVQSLIRSGERREREMFRWIKFFGAAALGLILGLILIIIYLASRKC